MADQTDETGVDVVREKVIDFLDKMQATSHPPLTNVEVVHALAEVIASYAFAGGRKTEQEERLQNIGEI